MDSTKDLDTTVKQKLRCPPPEILVEHLEKEVLINQAQERSKQQPLLQRIIKSLSKSDHKFREVLISEEGLETRVAVLVDGILESLDLERRNEQNLVGAIFKGRIQNLEPGLKAAFVITGQEKNAFLHYWDMLPAANENFEIVSPKSDQKKVTLEDIPSMYPIGSEILVQITKGQIGTKGPRVTTNIALPGRYLVLTPFNDQCGISKKIEDHKERERLRQILKQLTVPQGMGIIIRTVGEGKKLKFFVRDLSILLKEWNEISNRANQSDEPCLIYQEPDLAGRSIRDFLTEDIDRIITDSSRIYCRILEHINEFAPRMRNRVHLYEEPTPIFEHFNVEKQVLETFSKRVPLPSGGEIVIEETEALTAIDVNTGGHKLQSEEGKNFILQVNLEAAAEIARQLKLRNLGGLIIIDFIDMKNKSDQKRLCETMHELMERDVAKFQILPISAMGIMQMTRQRHSQSHSREMRTPCPYCEGKGSIKSPRTMATAIFRKLAHLAKNQSTEEKRTYKTFLHPQTFQTIKILMSEELGEIEQRYNIHLIFYSDPTIHRENFRILDINRGVEMN